MTPDRVITTLTELINRVMQLAATDPELRKLVQNAAKEIVALAGASPAATDAAIEDEEPSLSISEGPFATSLVEGVVAASEPKTPVVVGPEVPEAAPATVAAAAPPPTTASVQRAPTGYREPIEVPDEELPRMHERCLLKARGARWAAKRQRLMASGADFRIDIEPLDRDLIDEARRLPECFLWMNHYSGPVPSNPVLFEDLGGCFETTADALSGVQRLLVDADAPGDEFERALNLLAEAQAGLRVAVERVGYKRDLDQFKSYLWLRARCHDDHIYIERYMRLGDDPEPADWAGLGQRIEALEARVRTRQRTRQQRESALKRINYHLKPILQLEPGNRAHDWNKIIATVDEIVSAGTAPSAVDLRELLLPAVDLFPDVPLPVNVQRVLREIDRYLASRPTREVEAAPSEERPEIGMVAERLRGRTIVLIGGLRRPLAQEALRRAFDLDDVDWVETREHESTASFEAHVSRPDVVLVLLAIRWCSHSFSDVKVFCDRHGKMLVRLPGGYNADQVAVQILAQCGERLLQGS
jgi:hypothetical protein